MYLCVQLCVCQLSREYEHRACVRSRCSLFRFLCGGVESTLTQCARSAAPRRPLPHLQPPRAAVNFSFVCRVDARASGSLWSRVCLTEVARPCVNCDTATRVSNASYHLDVLHRMRCSTPNSHSRAHLSGGAVFSPLSWRTSNHHTSDSSEMLDQIELRASCVLERAHVLVFFLASVLKNSASVVARDSALTVTVLKCFSSASVFSRVSLMASL